MIAPTMTLQDVARELGRSPSWVDDNLPHLVATKQLPAPLHDGGRKVWNTAHVYALLDRKLAPAERAAAAAYRAAVAAASLITTSNTEQLDHVASRRIALNQKFEDQPA